TSRNAPTAPPARRNRSSVAPAAAPAEPYASVAGRPWPSGSRSSIQAPGRPLRPCLALRLGQPALKLGVFGMRCLAQVMHLHRLAGIGGQERGVQRDVADV